MKIVVYILGCVGMTDRCYFVVATCSSSLVSTKAFIQNLNFLPRLQTAINSNLGFKTCPEKTVGETEAFLQSGIDPDTDPPCSV